MIDGYEIKVGYDEMDVDAVHAFITASYWSKGIPRETLNKAMQHSLCFGIFESSGAQVGFARAVTDTATYAYLGDVYVLEEHRGKGLSKWLLSTIVDHPNLQRLRRISLATADAHSLYERFGFKALARPELYMETWNPDVYNDG